MNTSIGYDLPLPDVYPSLTFVLRYGLDYGRHCSQCPQGVQYICVSPFCTGLVDEDNVPMAPGFFLNSAIGVPALKLPATTVTALLADGSGVVQRSVTFKVNISDISTLAYSRSIKAFLHSRVAVSLH